MNEFLSLIKQRRSIRKFNKQTIEKEKLELILRSVLWAPSSRGINPWEFIILEGKDLLLKLSTAKHGAGFLKEAALGIVVIADTSKSDVWIEDASIVSGYMLLAVEALGLGACWIQIRNRMYDDKKTANEYVREILNIPLNYEVESIIVIGYPDEKLEEHSENELDWNKVHKNTFGIK